MMPSADDFDRDYDRAVELLQGRPDEAEPILLRAIALLFESRGPLSEEVGWAAQNLAKMYEAMGNRDRAILLIHLGSQRLQCKLYRLPLPATGRLSTSAKFRSVPNPTDTTPS